MSKDCQNGGLRYREQSTVLGHISRLFKGGYLGLEMTFRKRLCKKHRLFTKSGNFGGNVNGKPILVFPDGKFPEKTGFPER